MAVVPVGFEDELILRLEMEQLPKVISLLPEVQRRRLTAYFYEGLTYREIAAREGVDHKAMFWRLLRYDGSRAKTRMVVQSFRNRR